MRSRDAAGAQGDARRYVPALERGAVPEYDREADMGWSGEGRDVMVLTRMGKEKEHRTRREDLLERADMQERRDAITAHVWDGDPRSAQSTSAASMIIVKGPSGAIAESARQR